MVMVAHTLYRARVFTDSWSNVSWYGLTICSQVSLQVERPHATDDI